MESAARKKKEEEIRNAEKRANELKDKIDGNNALIISLALDNGKSKEDLLKIGGLKEEDIDKVIKSRTIETPIQPEAIIEAEQIPTKNQRNLQ